MSPRDPYPDYVSGDAESAARLGALGAELYAEPVSPADYTPSPADRERLRLNPPRPCCGLTPPVMCDHRPVGAMSACLLDAGHDGLCVVAQRTRAGAAFYWHGPGGLALAHETEISYAEPTRRELADTWAWLVVTGCVSEPDLRAAGMAA
jgi:hypothetical protein